MIAHRRALTLTILVALAAPALLACGEDHTDGVAPATVAPTVPAPVVPAPAVPAPSAPTAAEVPAASPTALTIDRAASSVGFTAAKVTASHDGSFTDFAGTIDLPGTDPTQGRVSVTIQMGSLVIEPARLSSHLRTPDLLDVERFPTATFESTSIAAGGTGAVAGTPATHTVTGSFTLHGQTRTITFPAVISGASDAVTASAEFSFRRHDFGITYPGMPDDLIRDEVVIRFQVRAPRTPTATAS